MMNFDNRSGSRLFQTKATHDSAYQQKLKELRDNYEIQQTQQSANAASNYLKQAIKPNNG